MASTKKRRKAALLGLRLASAKRLLLLLLPLSLPAAVQAQFYSTVNNGTITITGYNGFKDITRYKARSEIVTIPDTINGLPVTRIGDHAFYNHYDLISATIPGSVTSI